MERVYGNTYTTICKIDSGNLLSDSGNSNQDSMTTQRGGRGSDVGGRFKREETYVYLWLIHVDKWQKPTQYCKATILQLKITFFKKCKASNHGFLFLVTSPHPGAIRSHLTTTKDAPNAFIKQEFTSALGALCQEPEADMYVCIYIYTHTHIFSLCLRSSFTLLKAPWV